MLNKILRLCVGQRVKGRPSDIERNAKRCNEGCELMPTAEGPNPLTKATTLQPCTRKRRR